jgi:acetolactate synthase-1/3 small subunit
MTRIASLQRELIMIKVSASVASRTEVVELAQIFKAKIIDVTNTTVSLEMTGTLDKIDSFLSLISPYGIVELARTGITALERGSRALSSIGFDEIQKGEE